MSTPSTITLTQARRVLEVVDAGLVYGKGIPEPGKMCVEAAVCFALGLPHGDEPPCVARSVRSFKIRLNDSRWSSNAARTLGMRKLAIAQLGSKNAIDEKKFVTVLAQLTISKLLPVVLRDAARKQKNGVHKKALIKVALICETNGDRKAVLEAKKVANAAYANAAYAYAYAYAAYAAYAADVANAVAYANAAYANAAYANAAYAADAADAADADADVNKYLFLSATLCIQALREVNAPGILLMDKLIPRDDTEVS